MIAGGVIMHAGRSIFYIGQKNYIAGKANLLIRRIKIISEDVGGEVSRTSIVRPESKMLLLNHSQKGNWEI